MSRSPQLPLLAFGGLLALGLGGLAWWLGSDQAAQEATRTEDERAVEAAATGSSEMKLPGERSDAIVSTSASGETGRVALRDAAPDEPEPFHGKPIEVFVVDSFGNPVDGATVWAEAQLPPEAGDRAGVFSRGRESRSVIKMDSSGRVDPEADYSSRSFYQGFLTLGSAYAPGPLRLALTESLDGFATLDVWPRVRGDLARDLFGQSGAPAGEPWSLLVEVKAGGPFLRPTAQTLDLADYHGEQIRVLVRPFGTLELELEPQVEDAQIFTGRLPLELVPALERENSEDTLRSPLVLPLFGIRQELDVHVLGFEGAVDVGPRRPIGPEERTMIDFEVSVQGSRAMNFLTPSGGMSERLYASKLRGTEVYRVSGPSEVGTTKRLILTPGKLLPQVSGALVDGEGWNVGRFDGVFSIKTYAGLHRFSFFVDKEGGFSFTLPQWLVDEGPEKLTIVAHPSTRQEEPVQASALLPRLEPGRNDLGNLTLRPMPLLVAGRVVDENGDPMRGLVMALYERTGGRWFPLPGPLPGQWRTGGKGEFNIYGLDDGRRLGIHVRQEDPPAAFSPLEFSPPSVGLELIIGQ